MPPTDDDDSAKTAACYRYPQNFLVFMHEMTKNLKLIERSVAKVVAQPRVLLLMLHSKLLIKLTLGVDLRDALRLEEGYVYCKDTERESV